MASMGAEPAPRAICSTEQIPNMSFTSAKPRSSQSCHPKIPGDSAVPKAPGPWVRCRQVQH